jgi:hypothetical protein
VSPLGAVRVAASLATSNDDRNSARAPVRAEALNAHDTLTSDPDTLEEDEDPVTADVSGLRYFLES